MRNILIIFVLLASFFSCKWNYITNQSFIDVNANLVRTYDTIPSWDTTSFKAFDINLVLTNNTDKSITFWLMTCSWEWNFEINNDYIQIISKGCPRNFPTHIKLDANESLSRKATVIKYNDTFGQFIKATKFGFIYIDSVKCKTSDDYLNIIADISKQNNIVWSNELFLNEY